MSVKTPAGTKQLAPAEASLSPQGPPQRQSHASPGLSSGSGEDGAPPSRTQLQLLRHFACVYLVSLQFGLDSTLWLPTVLPYLEAIVEHNGATADSATRYLSYAQTIPAAIQVVVSLTVGLVAAKVGSLKWPLVFCVFCSAAGSLIYTAAGPGAINDPWAVIGGRMLAGLASGSSSLAMSYIVIGTNAQERLEAMSLYRTGAGIAMVLGPLMSIGLTHVSFTISGYRIDGTNAMMAVSFCISSALVLVLIFGLENKSKASPNAFKALAHTLTKEPSTAWTLSALILLVMLVSAYSAADVMYLLSDMLISQWDFSLSLTSGLQAAVYAVALVTSLGVGPLRAFVMRRLSRAKVGEEAHEGSKDEGQGKQRDNAAVPGEAALANAERSLTVFSFLAILVGLIILVVAFALAYSRSSIPADAGTAVAFLFGATIIMGAYNIQASTLPTLFSKSLPANLRAALTPWYAATVAAGKIFAPLIDQGLANAKSLKGEETVSLGYTLSRIIPFAFAIAALVFLLAYRRRIVAGCSGSS